MGWNQRGGCTTRVNHGEASSINKHDLGKSTNSQCILQIGLQITCAVCLRLLQVQVLLLNWGGWSPAQQSCVQDTIKTAA